MRLVQGIRQHPYITTHNSNYTAEFCWLLRTGGESLFAEFLQLDIMGDLVPVSRLLTCSYTVQGTHLKASHGEEDLTNPQASTGYIY